tara:strand:- start:328 stop:852 length:525 start_codon:yes stop_codon:yes gene_type:complete
LKLKFVIFLIFLSNSAYASNIGVVDINSLIDDDNRYIDIILEIESSQNSYLENFQNKEKELQSMLDKINESKLILNDNEINIQIDNYNKELNKFSLLIEEFNIHYQNEIINIRELLLSKIIVLLEKYAIENNIDIIFDSTNYLIASNSIDITDIIGNELSKIDLELEYKNFEKN